MTVGIGQQAMHSYKFLFEKKTSAPISLYHTYAALSWEFWRKPILFCWLPGVADVVALITCALWALPFLMY